MTWERVAWGTVVLGLAGLCAMLLWTRTGVTSSAPDSTSRVASITLPPGVQLTGEDPARFVLSPDGSRLAFVAARAGGQVMLWIRPLDSLVAQEVPGTEGASHPFWSPDSGSIAFTARPKSGLDAGRGQLKRIDLATGRVAFIADTAFNATGAWNADDVILFTPAGDAPLHRVPAGGGTPKPATTLERSRGDVQHSFPHFLPDGRTFLYSTVGTTSGGATDIQGVYAGRLDSSDPAQLVVERGYGARYASGHLLFVIRGTLTAQPFDPATLQLSGRAAPVTERLLAGGIGGSASAAFSVSDNGLLVYQATTEAPTQLRWFDRDGTAGALVGGPSSYSDVVLSRDGTRLAVSIRDSGGGGQDIWTVDLSRGLFDRATSHASDEFAPVWSPKGDTLAYSAVRDGSVDLYRLLPGQQQEEKLDQSAPGLGKFAASWSPDGSWILYIAGARIIARSDLMALPLAGERKPRVFADSEFVETQARFSPDGRWIAYTAYTGTRAEIYVNSFPERGAPVRVSSTGGSWPHWNGSGTEVFFIDLQRQINVASVDGAGSTFKVGDVRALFAVPVQRMPRLDAYPYDVTPDGKRFLVNTQIGSDLPSTPITFITNWPASLPR